MSALKRYENREKLVIEFAPGVGLGAYAIHDPSVGYLMSGVIGWPDDPRNSCTILFTGVGQGIWGISEITLRSEVPDPEQGDKGFWLLTVCLSRKGKHHASLDMTNAEDKFFRDAVGNEDLDRITSGRFEIGSLSDYARLVRPDLIKLASIDLEAFDPRHPEVRIVRPSEVPPEDFGALDL